MKVCWDAVVGLSGFDCVLWWLWGTRVAAEAAKNKADARLEAERKQVRHTHT